MIKSEISAKKINSQIQKWLTGDQKLVVAIDGYAGSGKTTIAQNLSKINKNIEVVHLDDFINHWKVRKRMMGLVMDKSKVFEYQWYRLKDLEKLIRVFKKSVKGKSSHKIYNFDTNDFHKKEMSYDLSKKILVIDGIFLLHPGYKINKLIDKTVYIYSNPLKADKQRIAREKKRFGKNYLSEDNPDNWIKYFKIAYRNYLKKYNPHKNADFLIK